MARDLRVICAPDKFKQACSAAQAARAMAQGVRQAAPGAQITELPLADGGEGTLDVLRSAFPDQRSARVPDALGRPVQASYALSADGKRALIESAQACGLWRLAENERNPLKTSTHGVGELVQYALDARVKEVVIGLGGSATSDGGAGMLVALGARVLDAQGRDVAPNGAELKRAHSLDLSRLDSRLKQVKLTALCDVQSPMLGEGNASRKFVVQKGGTTQAVPRLEAALVKLQQAAATAGCRATGLEPGSGAAGGLGFGVLLMGGTLQPGAATMLELLGFEALIRGADVVLTGEGSFDSQTADGKLIAAVAESCVRVKVPLVVLAGVVAPDVSIPGVTAAFGIARYGARRQDNLQETETCLQTHAEAIARLMTAR